MNLQVLTDRFAKTSSSSTSACSDLSSYCGGTWKGMEQRLDYIQGLGFDAIWITPIVTSRLQFSDDLIAIFVLALILPIQTRMVVITDTGQRTSTPSTATTVPPLISLR